MSYANFWAISIIKNKKMGRYLEFSLFNIYILINPNLYTYLLLLLLQTRRPPTLTIFAFSLLRHCSSNSGGVAAAFRRYGSQKKKKTEPSLIFDCLSLFSVLLQLLRCLRFPANSAADSGVGGKIRPFPCFLYVISPCNVVFSLFLPPWVFCFAHLR